LSAINELSLREEKIKKLLDEFYIFSIHCFCIQIFEYKNLNSNTSTNAINSRQQLVMRDMTKHQKEDKLNFAKVKFYEH